MPKPVCVACQRFFRPYRNGVRVLEQKPVGGRTVPPGTANPELWVPYKVWMADSYRCEGCGTVIVVGFGHDPMWQDYHPAEMPQIHHIVNDC